nr:lipase family protein [Clostridia bacterium]
GNEASEGGGIYVANDGTTIKSCNITGNNATSSGDGVYVERDIDYEFNITGKCVIKDNDGNKASSNVYMADSIGRNSNVGIEGLMTGSDVHIGFRDPINGMEVSQFPGTYDTRWLTCDNDNMHFEWDRSTRHLYLREGSKPEPGKGKTKVNAGTVNDAGNYGDYKLIQGYLEHGDSLDATLDTDVKFFYSDGYFDQGRSPEVYNDHLATTSLNFAMSSINTSYGGTDDYKGKHEAVRQFLADIGCDDQDIYVNDFYTQRPTTKSIGVAIAKKKLVKSGDEDTGKILIPVAIRSAAYELEWVNNAMLGTSGEAAGFSSAATTAMNELEKYIAKNKLEEELEKGNVKFWIVGYSRGGATANLLSKRVIDKYGVKNSVYAYTWATPIGGEKGQNSSKYYSIHNCLNYADLVPLVAPSKMGFVRYGVDHYIPGTNAGEPANYKDEEENTCVADNTPLITKTNAYNRQRDKMLNQLTMVDSTKFFDDYFHPAYVSTQVIDLLFGLNLFVPGGNGDITAEKFERDLINALQDNTDAFSTRKSYAETVYTLNSKKYNTAESAVGEILGLVFGGDDLDDFITDASTFANYFPTVDPSETSLGDLYDDLLGDWHTLTEQEKESYKTILYDKLAETGALQHLTDDQRTALGTNFPVLLNLALQFEDGDFYNKEKRYGVDQNAVLAGTAAYNLGRLIPNHYSEVYLAWTRTYDDFYNDETEEFEIVKPETINKPAARVVKRTAKDSPDKPEYKMLSAEKVNILKGDTRVILDADHSLAPEGKNTSGEAIYYTLKNEKTGVTSPEQIYRGGVDLILDNPEGTEYTLTAYAMQYNKKSKSETFRLLVEDPRHKVKVDGKKFFYDEGVSVSVAADPKEGKVFDHWEATMTRVGSDADRTLNLTGSDTEAVKVAKMMFGDDYGSEIFNDEILQFTMPVVGEELSREDYENYDLEFRAVYADRISSITVTDITSGGNPALPAAGQNLPDSMVFEGDAGEMGISTNKTDNIQWSYEYKGNTVSASGEAYNSTEYTATVV